MVSAKEEEVSNSRRGRRDDIPSVKAGNCLRAEVSCVSRERRCTYSGGTISTGINVSFVFGSGRDTHPSHLPGAVPIAQCDQTGGLGCATADIPLCRYHSRSFNPSFDKNLNTGESAPVRIDGTQHTQIRIALAFD